MIYRIFRSGAPRKPIAELTDLDYPLLKRDKQISLTIDGKECLYTVEKVGTVARSADGKVALDLWVKDCLPKSL